MLAADSAHLANVFHRDRLAAPGVVGDSQHHQRDPFAADFRDQRVQSCDIQVALEGMFEAGLAAFGNHQIHRLRPDELDIGAGGIEVRVVRNDVSLLAGDVEQNALGGPALMGGNDVLVAENVLDGVAEVIEAAAARVAFVAFHEGRPLMSRHGAGAGVRQQVNQHVIGR